MRTTKAIITIFLALLAVSCAKEPIAEQSPADWKYVSFNATLGADPTKTYLDGVQVKWQATDSVSLWYGKLDSAMTQTNYFVGSIDSDDARTATLKGLALESENYVAVYPLSATNDCSKKGKITATIPTEQTIKAGSFDQGANVAVAYSDNTTLSFKNVGGLMALKVASTGGHLVSSFRLTGTAALTGEVEIQQSGSLPSIQAVTDGVTYVAIDCGDGIEDPDPGANEEFTEEPGSWDSGTKSGAYASATKAPVKSGGNIYYMAVLPGSHTGFALTFVDSDGKAAIAKSSHSFTIERNSNTLIANISLSDADFKTDPQVYINEIDCQNKKIELYNPGSASVDLTGWVLTKDESSWAFPVGSAIPENGYYVVTCKQKTDCSAGPMFGISGDKGFDLKLSNGSLVDRIDNLTSITTIADGETYGRRTDGAAEWVLFSSGTIYESGVCDGDNSKGTVKTAAGIVLNEINGNDKYVELYNVSDQAIDITGWTLSKDDKVVWTASDASQRSIAKGAYLTIDFVKKSTDPTQAASGLSAGKNLKVELKNASGGSIDVFIRGEEGTEGWGETTLPENTAASFCRVPNGSGVWKYAAPTKNAVNGPKTGTIEQYPAANGALVLNELDGNNKFIELYNTSTDYSISLEDVTIYKDDGTDPIWTGLSGYAVEPGGWVLLYSEDVKTPATYDSGLIFSSGLSSKKTLKIEMKSAPASGDPTTLDTFTRGSEPWNVEISSCKSNSFGRTPDGTGDWKLTDSTPGAANGASKGDIPQS